MNRSTLFFAFCILTFCQIESSSQSHDYKFDDLLRAAATLEQPGINQDTPNNHRKRSFQEISVQTEGQNLVPVDDVMSFVNSNIRRFEKQINEQSSDQKKELKKQEEAFKQNIKILANALSDKDRKIETLQQSLINAKFSLENNQKNTSQEISALNEKLKAQDLKTSEAIEIGRAALNENKSLKEQVNHFKNATVIQSHIITAQNAEIKSLKATLASKES
ncbi:MAG: hypothetical protein ACXWL2_00585 [Candidatus Chromulinivorax sp.]